MDFVFFGKAPDGELYTLYGFGSSLEPPPKKKKKPRKRRGHQYSAKRKQANFKLKLDAVRNKRDDDDGAWGGELEALLEQHGDQGGL